MIRWSHDSKPSDLWEDRGSHGDNVEGYSSSELQSEIFDLWAALGYTQLGKDQQGLLVYAECCYAALDDYILENTRKRYRNLIG